MCTPLVKGGKTMDLDKKFKMIKIASTIAFLLTLLTWGGMTYYHYQKLYATDFDDVGEIKKQIQQNEKSNPSPFTITKEQYHQQSKSGEPPIDEELPNEDKMNADALRLFKDQKSVVKYMFTSAMMGKKDEFFYQFDPNVLIKDFPDPQKMAQEEEKVFDQITHHGTLQHMKIVDDYALPDDGKYRVVTDLYYAKGEKATVQIDLVPMADEHSGVSLWYAENSVVGLAKQTETK
jgi:hypothetical protein